MRLSGVQMTPELDAYLEAALPARDPVLHRMERELVADDVPGIGPVVGQLLELLTRIGRCVDAIELGAATGYSAIWLARGCSGRVTTLELDAARAERARRNLAEAGLGDRVSVVEEDAIGYLERASERVDCVFNDLLTMLPEEALVDRCVEASIRRLNPGGLLMADNALRRGEVVAPGSRAARNAARYNHLVAHDPRLESVIVPLRDGVSVGRLR